MNSPRVASPISTYGSMDKIFPTADWRQMAMLKCEVDPRLLRAFVCLGSSFFHETAPFVHLQSPKPAFYARFQGGNLLGTA